MVAQSSAMHGAQIADAARFKARRRFDAVPVASSETSEHCAGLAGVDRMELWVQRERPR
jgi:hypothetical protein